MEKDWVLIFSSTTLHEVHMNRIYLEENGIESIIINKQDSVYNAFGDIDESCKYFYKAAKFGDVDAQETFDNFCEKDQLRTLFKPRKKLEKVSF